ncbi:integrin alpha-X-like [Aplochiton taeniatus]
MDSQWTRVQLRSLMGPLLLFTVVMGFNFDTHHPAVFNAADTGSHFGHRVCHFRHELNDSVLVTAPLHANRTGGLYRCSYHSNQCHALPVKVDPEITLGLSLACNTDRAMVCGPHLIQSCDSLNYLNGLCVELGPELSVLNRLTPGFEECHNFGLDAVILFDGSQSIVDSDFNIMIKFIKNIIGMFTDPNAQVAVAQYSTEAHAIFQFENFAADPNPDSLMSLVDHAKGQTYTPSAIRYVLEQMMREDRGMRRNSRKLLVVITDGKSNDPRERFSTVIPMAERRGVNRIAIGVGNEVSKEELQQIASSQQSVFAISSFEALVSIQHQLREGIFNIEGTNTANGSSFGLQLSQGGFSTHLSGDMSLFGAVGAYSWSGGVFMTSPGKNETFVNVSALGEDMADSYLGYSVEVADTESGRAFFAGAPRYQHTGLVLGFQRDPLLGNLSVTHRVEGSQLGSYFGAELCVLQVFGEGRAGLLLIGAPFYHAAGVGGEVLVCTLGTGETNCSHSLRGAPGNVLGQFGTSLSSCPDLNGDGIPELAVGAPQEDNGQGSLYIFLGKAGGIQTKHSQRIRGTKASTGLRFFGLSVHSAGDLSSDGLADLVVGSKGSVFVLRSQPVMAVLVSVSLDPPLIPRRHFHCAGVQVLNLPVATATFCVTVRGVHTGKIKASLSASVSMTVELDGQRKPARVQFHPSSASFRWAETVSDTACHNVSISIPRCIMDYRPVSLIGQLSSEGLEVEGTGGLKSVLSPDSPTSFTHMILLDKVCGEDHVCVSDLNVSPKFTSPEVLRSPGFSVDLSVEVANRGEDSSETVLTVVHPTSITFLRAKQASGQAAVWCSSNGTESENRTSTVCSLSATVIQQDAKMTVWLSFTVADPSALEERLRVNVSVIAGDSTQHISFPDNRWMEHVYMVENMGDLTVPVNATFVVPVEWDSGFQWNVSIHEEQCKAVTCRLFNCSIGRLTNNKSPVFQFRGNISKTMNVKPGVQSEVVSYGMLTFDQSIYTQYPAHGFQSHTIVSIVETPPQSRTTLIVSISVLCTLCVLLAFCWTLYKIGFFKSKAPPSDVPEVVSKGSPDFNSLRETTL